METVIAVILGLFSVAGTILGALHVKSTWVQSMLARLIHEADAAVREVAQTYTDELVKASIDGSLTDEEKREARRRAVATLKANLGTKGWHRLMRILGIEDEERYAVTQVEAAVNRAKTSAQNVTVVKS